MSADEQREMDQRTWQALQDRGVVEGRPLTVEVFFFAPDEPSARRLAADLRAEEVVAEARSTTSGRLRRHTSWSVTGTAQLPAVDLATLDALVLRLEEVAARHGAEFDGWGAETS